MLYLSLMLLLEALFALLRKSLGNIVRAIFGWATLALFGEVGETERTWLSVVVGAAAAWPVMVWGVIFPRQAALILALAPIPKGVPASAIRIAWITMTVLIPLLVGFALGRKTAKPKGSHRLRSLLMGFPATLGLAVAFAFALFAVPARKLAALAAGRKEEHVPLVLPASHYHAIVEQFRQAILDGGIPVEPSQPPWGTRVLGRIMQSIGGAILGTYLPAEMEFLRGDEIELTIYPNGVRIYGREKISARAHALLAECATRTAALQCMSADGQKIERRIKVLAVKTRDSGAAHPGIQPIVEELAGTWLSFREWEILYRQLLQVAAPSRTARLIKDALRRIPTSRDARAGASGSLRLLRRG